MVASVAIVGANLAGGRAAEALRLNGYEGRIVLIGEERWLPYERPPLSKECLWDRDQLPENFFLHDQQWYEDNKIELELGQRAEALELSGGAVRLASGKEIRADRFLLATGGKARLLPLDGATAANVHHLRTKDDADRLAVDLKPGARIVVIGMGVIGAEVAASARKSGCEVTAIEPAPVPMIRTLGAHFGAWLGREHDKRGVTAHYGIGVTRLHLDGGLVRTVELDDGTRIDCDAVVVGIGIVPSTELAANAGLAIGNGIVVDRQGRTSHEAVFAAGDVADQPNFFGGRVRLETYQNAADQGMAAAQAMIGREVDYLKPCWFWSDQYDINIQVSGRIDDSLPVVMRGELDSSQFTAFFLDGNIVAGVLTANRAVDMGVGKRMVERRLEVDPAQLGDASIPLREFLKPKAQAA